MPDTTNVTQLYHELLQLFEAAQQLQAQSAQLLEEACQARAVMPAVSDATVPLDSNVALSPEQTLDAMIGLLSDFSLETQVAITKALALGMVTTVRTRLQVKRPSVA